MKRTLMFVALAGALATVHAQSARFECGGVGASDQDRIKAQAASYDALLTFAESGGAYLADVQVRIDDVRGATVLEARCEGPLMLVDLPSAGTYQVTATVNGQTRQQKIKTGRGTARAVFVWPKAG